MYGGYKSLAEKEILFGTRDNRGLLTKIGIDIFILKRSKAKLFANRTRSELYAHNREYYRIQQIRPNPYLKIYRGMHS